MKIKAPVVSPVLVNKGDSQNITTEVEVAESLTAPVEENQIVGKVVVKNGENILTEYDIVVSESVIKLDFFTAFRKLLTSFSK